MSTPYGAPPPAGPSASSGNGTLILVLGILSIICLPVLGPIAWIMGNNALPTASPDQAGQITAGRICGIIGTVLLVLAILWYIFFIVLAVGMHHAIPMPPASAY